MHVETLILFCYSDVQQLTLFLVRVRTSKKELFYCFHFLVSACCAVELTTFVNMKLCCFDCIACLMLLESDPTFVELIDVLVEIVST